MPQWLIVVSWIYVGLGILSALVVVAHLIAGHRQSMWIMNVVWPVTALWSGPPGAWAYFRYGRAGSREAMHEAERHGREPPSKRQSFPILVAKGTMHCGSGCTLGDIGAELFALGAPLVIFDHRLFGAWIYDYIAAFTLGIAFQFFTIKPMRQSTTKEALEDALKADTLSLTAWQIGMYGWMAIVTFAIFQHELRASSVVFWFMMQIAMFMGFSTSYPVNWWLLRKGIKEAM